MTVGELQAENDDLRRRLQEAEEAIQALRDGAVGYERLGESEALYRTLVEQVKEHAIFGADLDGRAITWNEGVRRVLGFSEDEFIGKDIVETIFTPEDVASGVAEKELAFAIANGSASDDRWMRRKDGTRFWAAGITTARKDESGTVVGFTKVMRDMTAQKTMEEELRQFAADLSEADRRKDEFLAMLAHELRNPLAPIHNAVEVLQSSHEDPTIVRRCVEIVRRQVGQMMRFVDDLLDVSRVSRGRIELRKSLVELNPILQDAIDAAGPLCEANDHRLDVGWPDKPIYLNVDPARVTQVVGNLLNNACKFTEPGGRIRLQANRDGDSAEIQVSDNGRGLDSKDLPRIFELFTQVDTSLERAQTGLGIGLTLVKNLVEMHGGTIKANSDGPGKGSRFTVRLPISEQAPDEPNVQPDPRTVPAVSRRILVVDDNRDSASSLAVLLGFYGHETHVAHDGLEAVEVAETFHPDVVLLDIGLPKLNGYEAAKRIRSQPLGADMLLVALTGWGQEEDQARSRDAGFDAHLVKPLDLVALVKLLAAARQPLE